MFPGTWDQWQVFASSPLPLPTKLGSNPVTSVFTCHLLRGTRHVALNICLFIQNIIIGRTKEGEAENRTGSPGRGREDKGLVGIGVPGSVTQSYLLFLITKQALLCFRFIPRSGHVFQPRLVTPGCTFAYYFVSDDFCLSKIKLKKKIGVSPHFLGHTMSEGDIGRRDSRRERGGRAIEE